MGSPRLVCAAFVTEITNADRSAGNAVQMMPALRIRRPRFHNLDAAKAIDRVLLAEDNAGTGLALSQLHKFPFVSCVN